MNYKILPQHIQQPLMKPVTKPKLAVNQQSMSFQSVLDKTINNNSGELKISKHAEKRLEDRGINISPEMWESIHSKIIDAKNKGVQDSLVVTNNAALVISAKNETVITAMDRKEAESQLFTNIDGTILMD
ncbi:TIGR02530 family flagellar biosynthesis protein [Evansella sp. AB-P1]|uniref:TIGR02530 family flagellar biosynthesis protein n=1 Tax=Evansella sp. AB-P1 TaxID=3037653 RepID=UPI00242047DC|nr:TIGR02530 family flagellar biosynthesis protein [Evansella sp. AB-P1]MDG5788185.1 TIGR02530 family flagellar biosynthesis protein [Evansella sp. AB-P1]